MVDKNGKAKEPFWKKIELFKSILQYGVGCYIFLFVIMKAFEFFLGSVYDLDKLLDYPFIHYMLKTSILKLVSQSMMVSAAIELAYMLFTPGPDEAVDPFILGIAGTALLVMSDNNAKVTDSMLHDALAVLLFTISLSVLFYLRFMLSKWFPKQFGDNSKVVSINESDCAEEQPIEESAVAPKDVVRTEAA